MKREKPKYFTIDEIHSALLGILTEFDRVCRENDLRYSLAYGTLIGAVRHKGFIPWDDDVDVVMPRPDYEKLYSLVKEGKIKLGSQFVLTEDRGKKAFYSFMKLMDTTYTLKRWSQKEVPYLYIDIFQIDGAPSEQADVDKLYHKCLKYSAIMALARWAVPEHKWMLILRALGFPVYLGATIYGMSRAANKINMLAAKNDFDTCERSGRFSFGTARWTLPRESFCNYVDLEFEGHLFRGIADWDQWLTMIYGDYMTPPPEGKRWQHNLKVYRTSPAPDGEKE